METKTLAFCVKIKNLVSEVSVEQFGVENESWFVGAILTLKGEACRHFLIEVD